MTDTLPVLPARPRGLRSWLLQRLGAEPGRLAELEAENARLTAETQRLGAIAEGRLKGVSLVEIRNGEVVLEGGPAEFLAEYMAQLLQTQGAGPSNYVEIRLQHPDMGALVLTLQRFFGKTPHDLRREAEVRVMGLERRLQEALRLAEADPSGFALAEAALEAQSVADGAQPGEMRGLVDALREFLRRSAEASAAGETRAPDHLHAMRADLAAGDDNEETRLSLANIDETLARYAAEARAEREEAVGRVEAAARTLVRRLRRLASFEARAQERLRVLPTRPDEVVLMQRDELGRLMREAQVQWAKEQVAPRAEWLVPYEDLPEPEREAFRRAAERVSLWTLIGLSAYLNSPAFDDPPETP